MRLPDVLFTYPDEALDRLAVDKLDEVAHLRLPREVLVQEITAALSSLSYVAQVLAPTRPPTYAFLKLLMGAVNHSAPAQGFRERVLEFTDQLTELAATGKTLPSTKDYPLYLRMLQAAWEDEGHVDRSEALLLGALRNELRIGIREHLLLEHHPLVRPVWDGPRSYEETRRHLLGTGLVLVYGDDYVLAEEVCEQIRRAWEIELEDVAYARLLTFLSGDQLRRALEASVLAVSGSKEERISRLVSALAPPAEVLDALHIDEVKDFCRKCNLIVSAAKADLVRNLVEHFDQGRDLVPLPTEPEASPAPEPRALEAMRLAVLLEQLRLDQLYDVLTRRELRRYGSKSERVERLVASPWSEGTLLDDLRRADLVDLCRRLEVPVSGVKAEIIDRLVEWALRQPLHREQPGAASDAPGPVPASHEPVVEGGATEGPPVLPPPGPEPAVSESTTAREQRTTPQAESLPLPSLVAAPEPDGLDEIQRSWPELGEDEQVVLAVLRAARSLNEREIERAAALHGLGWYLTKAHMADLLARLRRTGACPVEVRGSGRHNIYEWVGAGAARRGVDLDRQAARDVIDALRQGVVPDRHLDLLVVGQEAARRHLVELLDHVRQGRSEFKFVRGPYGAGKSFLCSWLRERALEVGMAASIVRIGPDQPLSELPVFFAGLVDGLRTAEKRDASALADVLESWLLAVHRQTATIEGFDPASPSDRARLGSVVEERIDEDLARLAGIDPGFGPAVRAFYRARLSGDYDTAAAALAWLRGSRTLGGESLRALGVRGHLEAEEVFPRMRALLRVIAEGRLQGLLLLLDELELVRRFPHARQRERAYETLRLLIDECGENRLPGCLLVSTGTDPLFEDERYGLASYPALAHRVAAPQTGAGTSSVRQPILLLEPLDGPRLLQVALRLRDIHGIAYSWPAEQRVPSPVLERMVDHATAFGEEKIGRPPRPFLREVVHLLDLCEDRPEIAPEDLLPGVGRGARQSAPAEAFLDRWEE